MASNFKKRIAQQLGVPLRIRARTLAEGSSTGLHRSATKGAGIEFAGHRAYVPGDDLRHIDRHARLRHNRLLVRQFHTDTERSIHLLVDTSASMAYAGPDTQLPSKLDVALLLAGALGYAAHKAGDGVALTLVNAHDTQTWAGRHGVPVEQVLSLLEGAQLSPASSERERDVQDRSPRPVADQTLIQANWQRAIFHLGSSMRRGAILFVLSDLLDFTPLLTKNLLALSTLGRSVRVAQILTPSELSFPFEGPTLFRDPETKLVVQADANKAKQRYLTALAELSAPLYDQLSHVGGSFLRVLTDSSEQLVLSQLVRGTSIRGQ